nr:hypothetical protein [uncultured Limnohabitans sp.]
MNLTESLEVSPATTENTLPIIQSGEVCRVVAEHITPLTRFDASHLLELEPEHAFGLYVELTLEQQLSFSISWIKGRGPLSSNADKLENSEAFQSELNQRLERAKQDGELALKQWADAAAGSYRRLMPAEAGFLFKPKNVGFEYVCNTCVGERKLACKKCNGKGTVNCYECDADGWVYCNVCNGTTKRQCFTCAGRGQTSVQASRQRRDHQGFWVTDYYTEYHNCMYCNGTGRSHCQCCDGGTVSCPTCDGGGHLNCSPCSATGKIDCVGCDATGKEHKIGIVKSEVTQKELITVDTNNTILSNLVLNRISEESFPSLGELQKVTHRPDGLILSTVHQIRLDVREAKIQAVDKFFVIYGFGPKYKVFSFENLAGQLLENDIATLEQEIKSCGRWLWRRNETLLDATANFLSSELNMNIAETLSEDKSLAEQFSDRARLRSNQLVDAKYPSRASHTLKSALELIYDAELFESTVYLIGLVGLVAALAYLIGWPMLGYLSAMTVAIVVGLLGWGILEWVTRRRVSSRFAGDLGKRVLAQLITNGSVQKWRMRAALSIFSFSLISIFTVQKAPFLHPKVTTYLSSQSPQQEVMQWDSQGPDFRLRTYPSRINLETLVANGDEKARLVLAWQLLLGADGTNKDVDTAERHLAKLQKPFDNSDPLLRSAKALLVLNKESKPDAIRLAAKELNQAANSNVVEARYWYARILLSETGPMFDAQKGITTLRQAADDKHAHAALTLGEYLSTGKYTKGDANLARLYLERARDAGLVEAEKMLVKIK